MPAARPVMDWQRAEAYTPLAQCGRQGFAWEWLRRWPDYQAACGRGHAGRAMRFGLHRFEPLAHGCPIARPIWCRQADPSVLVGVARQGREDLFDLSPLLPLATCHRDARGREHWLFSDGWHHIRLDLVAGTLTAAPVELHYRLVGLLRAEPPLRALDRLIGMVRGGRLLASQFPAEQRASRWAQILRVHDALVAGATQRQIADALFDLHDVRRWRITAPSWRNRVQRLTEAARRAASVDPRLWLQGRFP